MELVCFGKDWRDGKLIGMIKICRTARENQRMLVSWLAAPEMVLGNYSGEMQNAGYRFG